MLGGRALVGWARPAMRNAPPLLRVGGDDAEGPPTPLNAQASSNCRNKRLAISG